ncbi:hypothetical protein SODALDRAFT_295390 [Sodiomyces alkalinus F11]|uniref:Zinc/iron permease n=1 Tax=Sodiomyces alkalinus (strain CBS 110278 / VKM F-3762 / F11) TaxID=1314773 RepID=A0A3N2PVQ8_SODAK|nr:hypothetical protein SODALDRAFT_295390 [Sodiomyces alkalinus F11]ROT38564.1 hypothetical protein SODALDRAFT_295390 [Sodiomyces alkalinus F11]
MERHGLDNDTKGWIMCIVSGIACTAGASIIYVDLLISRIVPGKANFRIQDSNAFLACALSLSFGVMTFSALYSMLPESKSYLLSAGYSDQTAGAIMMGCFVGGFVGIQFVSRVLHRYMPSHVVDCDHTHDGPKHHARSLSRQHFSLHHADRHNSSRTTIPDGPPHHHHHHHHDLANGHPVETTPLLNAHTEERSGGRLAAGLHLDTTQNTLSKPAIKTRPASVNHRPSITQVQKRVISFVKDTKCNCDQGGACYGYSDPCGQECFKHVSNRSLNSSRPTSLLRTSTGTPDAHRDAHPAAATIDMPISPGNRSHSAASRDPPDTAAAGGDEMETPSSSDYSPGDGDVEAQHHHHVPANAFLSLGLQTSIAIALHKFPEGFITYATNHASPTLGFSVFMALFVHNITEGFAMALPLYMALGSRLRALVWSSLLGGLSQPLGAAIAVLWFRVAHRTHLSPDAVAYACMFAVTAGIMVSVGLQLFAEALCLDHNRNLCLLFGFLGMALLGVSSAIASQ